MKYNDLKPRTKQFALAIIRLVDDMPKNQGLSVIGKQILRSGTSVGANYRAACRAKSVKDFIAKMGIVEEEIDETIYWLELLEESGKLPTQAVTEIAKEANELAAITVASIRTAKSRMEK